MSKGSVAAAAALLSMGAGLAEAQTVPIQHDAVACIVVNKFPKMNACFGDTQLARARVFFRVEGTASWYFVDMKREAACHVGTLPRPRKNLLKKKIDYYVQGTSKAFAEGQTETYSPLVVSSARECKDRPVAPFVQNAAVSVFPSLPAGFAAGAAGLGAGALLTGAAVVGGATTVAVVSHNNKPTPPASTPGTPSTPPITPNPGPSSPPAGPPSPPPSVNRPPNGVFKVSPAPPIGQSPLNVEFNLCQSSDPDNDPLSFTFDFGDGKGDSGFCRASHVYTAGAGSSTGVSAFAATFSARTCVTDGFEGHEQCKVFSVQVSPVPKPGPTPTPNPCASDVAPPMVSLISPKPGNTNEPVNFAAAASDASGINRVEYYAQPQPGPSAPPPPGFTLVGTSTTPTNYPFSWNPDLGQACFVDYLVKAIAYDQCLKSTETAPVRISVFASRCAISSSAGEAGSLTTGWASTLTAPGAEGRVLVGGDQVFVAPSGRRMEQSLGRRGPVRFEAEITAADGRAGTWRFELQPLDSGRLRVISGDVVQVGKGAVVFRVQGRVGERVVFAIEAR